MKRDVLRTASVYALALSPLTAFGVLVCPIMNGRGAGPFASLLAAGFALALAIEAFLRRARPSATPSERWLPSFLLWTTPIAFAVLWEIAVWRLPVAHALRSGLLLIGGALTAGYFGSCWTSLREENEWTERLLAEGRSAPSIRFLGIARRLLDFAVASTLGTTLVVVLLFSAGLGADPWHCFLIVGGLVHFAVAAVAREYRRLFSTLFDQEARVLDRVRAGRFDVAVPLLSQDEFRKIAEGTNEMIAGLREREADRQTFGKFFSPETARRIRARGAKLGGERIEVTVLFTDVPNYTSISERLPPEQVVAFLNDYFSRVVAAVRRHGGELDKFIGDAAMAVFGLDGSPDPRSAGLRAALEIRDELATRSASADGSPDLAVGIGLHHGEVIAGNIGSADRLEHTVIGDAVNVASRVESATKALGVTVAASEAVVAHAAPDLRARLRDLGPQALKGKSAPVVLFGA